MANIRRVFGIKDDAIAGGSEYDDITGAVPDSDVFWPVTGATLDRNIERYDRNDEVRGRRQGMPPLPFRAAPVATIQTPAYASILGKMLKKTLGGTDVVTGTVAPYTHTFGILGFGTTYLPAIHVQIVRDDLNHKMSGGSVNRLALSFPLDSEGSAEIEVQGLFHEHFATAPPTMTFTGLSEDVMMLRDAQMFIDGSMTAVPDLTGFEFSYVNNVVRKWYAKRNIVTKTLGTPTQTRRLWFPSENKIGAMTDISYRMSFGNISTAQELAHDYNQIQKFVFEVNGAKLTSGGYEILRITIYNGVHTGGGAEGLIPRDDIVQSFDGGAFYSEADSADIKVELINDTVTVTT